MTKSTPILTHLRMMLTMNNLKMTVSKKYRNGLYKTISSNSLLNTKDLAALFDVSAKTISRWSNQGILPAKAEVPHYTYKTIRVNPNPPHFWEKGVIEQFIIDNQIEEV